MTIIDQIEQDPPGLAGEDLFQLCKPAPMCGSHLLGRAGRFSAQLFPHGPLRRADVALERVAPVHERCCLPAASTISQPDRGRVGPCRRFSSDGRPYRYRETGRAVPGWVSAPAYLADVSASIASWRVHGQVGVRSFRADQQDPDAQERASHPVDMYIFTINPIGSAVQNRPGTSARTLRRHPLGSVLFVVLFARQSGS